MPSSKNYATSTPQRRNRSEAESSMEESTPKKLNQCASPGDMSVDADKARELASGASGDPPVWAQEMLKKFTDSVDELRRTLDRKMDSIDETVIKIYSELAEMNDSLDFATNQAVEATEKANRAEQKSSKLEKDINSLNLKFERLATENERLREQVLNQEMYSRRNNIIIRGLREPLHEQSVFPAVHELMWKMGHADPASVPIAKAHRLGPKPRVAWQQPRDIIVRFTHVADRDEMFQHRKSLKNIHGGRISLSEDLPTETQEKRDYLLPILKEAQKKQEFKDTMLVRDKLIVKGKTYTMKTVNSLPEPLRPAAVSSRQNKDTFVFFSRLSPLSNFSSYPIEVEGVQYSCNEQYIQKKKAELAGDELSAKRVMEERIPKRMKAIGAGLKQLDRRVWEQRLPGILRACNQAKFATHSVPRDYLLSTGVKTIGEAKPKGPTSIGIALWDPHVLDQNRWQERNLMGDCLMEIRSQLK